MRTERFSLPLSDPLETADDTIDAREGFLIRVELDGRAGLGEATPLPGWTESLGDCAAALKGVNDPVAAIEEGALDDRPAARHGVSLAMLDARARRDGEPLYRYLGGPDERTTVPVNATVGDGEPEETAAAVASAVDDGYPAVKLKVGAGPLAREFDRLEAARERCPEVELRADANGAWTESTAKRALSRFSAFGVSFVEQPLPATDLADHAALSGGEVGVALDEGLVEHGVEAVIEAGAADVVVCKPMALGGLDRARAAAGTAAEAGLPAVVTTTIDGAVARAGAVHLAASLPGGPACGLATGDRLAADLREGVAPVDDGTVAVPQGKGNVPPH